jgi:hypothetical protein
VVFEEADLPPKTLLNDKKTLPRFDKKNLSEFVGLFVRNDWILGKLVKKHFLNFVLRFPQLIYMI